MNRILCKKCRDEVTAQWSESGTFFGYDECSTCGEEPREVIYEHFNGATWEPF